MLIDVLCFKICFCSVGLKGELHPFCRGSKVKTNSINLFLKLEKLSFDYLQSMLRSEVVLRNMGAQGNLNTLIGCLLKCRLGPWQLAAQNTDSLHKRTGHQTAGTAQISQECTASGAENSCCLRYFLAT